MLLTAAFNRDNLLFHYGSMYVFHNIRYLAQLPHYAQMFSKITEKILRGFHERRILYLIMVKQYVLLISL